MNGGVPSSVTAVPDPWSSPVPPTDVPDAPSSPPPGPLPSVGAAADQVSVTFQVEPEHYDALHRAGHGRSLRRAQLACVAAAAVAGVAVVLITAGPGMGLLPVLVVPLATGLVLMRRRRTPGETATMTFGAAGATIWTPHGLQVASWSEVTDLRTAEGLVIFELGRGLMTLPVPLDAMSDQDLERIIAWRSDALGAPDVAPVVPWPDGVVEEPSVAVELPAAGPGLFLRRHAGVLLRFAILIMVALAAIVFTGSASIIGTVAGLMVELAAIVGGIIGLALRRFGSGGPTRVEVGPRGLRFENSTGRHVTAWARVGLVQLTATDVTLRIRPPGGALAVPRAALTPEHLDLLVGWAEAAGAQVQGR